MRLVLIDWVDSLGCGSGWQPLEHCHPKPLRCRSVGWLIHDGEDCKVVVPHVTEDHENAASQGCGDMTIPVMSILHIVDLAVPAYPVAT